ncbi:MAG: hypothetical protein RLY31_2745 [Bacteroidota bacterium]|jgi:class 3 adenylate cyclase
MYRTMAILAFGLFGQCFLHGQSARLQVLEDSIRELTGEAAVRAALELSAVCRQEAKTDRAMAWADKAFVAARGEGWKDLQAKALMEKARTTSKEAGPLQVQRNLRAYRWWEEAFNTAESLSLRHEALSGMGELAGLLGRRREVMALERKLVQAGGARLMARLDSLENREEVLRDSQVVLEQVIREKEHAIRHMSQAQMQQQLLLAERERLLDSLRYRQAMDSLGIAQRDLRLERQAAALALKDSQRKLLIALAGLGLLLTGTLLYRYHASSRHNEALASKNQLIEAERQRAETLLHNILPAPVARELQETGTAAARRHDQVTVLFSDFAGFSAFSKGLPPETLVRDLDHAFRGFDRIVRLHRLEKIKTIGDAYMCAGGLDGPEPDHAVRMVRAALAFLDFLTDWNRDRTAAGLPLFVARIGIHTGPVVAGVVGSDKFAYDIWGETVNIAARMETASEPGRVNISAATQALVAAHFRCTCRGLIPARNIGEVEAYFVEEPV